MNQDGYMEYEDIIKNTIEYPVELNDMENRIRKKIRKRLVRSCYTGMGVFVGILVLFTSLINTSAVIAQAVDKIPVLGNLSAYIKFDRGLQNSVKNGYVQEVNLEQESNGYTLKMPCVVADSKRLVMFFELPESVMNPDNADLYEVVIDNDFLNELDIVGVDVQKNNKEYGAASSGVQSISIRSGDTMIPQDITIPVSLVKLFTTSKIYDGSDDSFDYVEGEPTVLASYEFKLHLNDYPEPKIIELNQEVHVLEQPVIIHSITQYPTGIEIKATAPNNGAGVISGLEIKGVDESGNTWGRPEGSRPAVTYMMDPVEITYYLECDYFKEEALVGLEITGAGMFLKEDRIVTIDLLNQTMTPAASDLYIKRIQRVGDVAQVTFESTIAQLSIEDFTDIYVFSHRYEDGKGNVYFMDIQSGGRLGGKMQYNISVVWPEDNQVVLERDSAPIKKLENPVKVSWSR